MLKTFAKIVSVVFHPLLIVTYMLTLILLINPYLFGVRDITEKRATIFLLGILLSTFFLPLFATLMLKFLGMAKSLELADREERYVPYIITGAFYLWIVVNFFNNSDIPKPYTVFILGATIALFLSFFINLFSKISAHAVGMGGLLAMVVITFLLFSYGSFSIPLPGTGALRISMNALLLLVILLTGLVGTCRLILKAHDPFDVYGGYIVGFSSQFIALRILLL